MKLRQVHVMRYCWTESTTELHKNVHNLAEKSTTTYKLISRLCEIDEVRESICSTSSLLQHMKKWLVLKRFANKEVIDGKECQYCGIEQILLFGTHQQTK